MIYSDNRTNLGKSIVTDQREQELEEQNELLMNYIDILEEELEMYNEQSESLNESKKLLGYKGTKSIEKKYNIPDKYCIERKDFHKLKKEDGLIKKIEKAAGYIKDQDDLNGYFGDILQRAFRSCNATNSSALAKTPNLSKLYNLYNRSYTGDEKISKEDLCKYVADINKSIKNGIAAVAIGSGVSGIASSLIGSLNNG